MTGTHTLHRARALPLALALLGLPARGALAQSRDTTAVPVALHGNLTVTNNGMSPIPSLSLGHPAAVLELAAVRGRASFEPQFRVGLDGKPWSFIFWGRYKLVDRQRLHVQLGGHPAYAFRTVAPTSPGASATIAVRRYLASELNTTYVLSRHVSVGMYNLFAYGLEPDAARRTHFESARMTVSGVPLGGAYALRLSPQLFVLHLDRLKGYYANGAVALVRRNSPWSLGGTINHSLRTSIAQGRGLIWNVSATYVMH